jgi:hypothetical protein
MLTIAGLGAVILLGAWAGAAGALLGLALFCALLVRALAASARGE